jgi:hypothetical protein
MDLDKEERAKAKELKFRDTMAEKRKVDEARDYSLKHYEKKYPPNVDSNKYSSGSSTTSTQNEVTKKTRPEQQVPKVPWIKKSIFFAWVAFCFWYFPERDGWPDTLRLAFIIPAYVWFVNLLLGGPKAALRWGGAMLICFGMYLAPIVVFGYWLEMPLVAGACLIGLTIWLSLGGGDPPDGGLDGSNY